MAFTDVEMAILSRCAYQLDFPDDIARKSLHSYLKDHKDILLSEKELGEGYRKAFDQLLAKTEGQPYHIVQSADDADGTGFAAFAVEGPNNEVTVACRGTEGFDVRKEASRKDMYADLQLVYSLQTNQQAQMEWFVRRLEEKGYESYNFTGHSLGGNLAMYGSAVLSDPSKLNRTVTYNSPGFNINFLTEYEANIKAVNSRIITYQNEEDYVSECFNVPGRVIILENGGAGEGGNGADPHSLRALRINENFQNFNRSKEGVKKKTWKGVGLSGVTRITDLGMVPFAAFDYWGNKIANASANLFEQRIRVPVGLLQEYAGKMQGFADTNADVFDRLYNSLLCLKENGEWQGTSLEAIVDTTEKNKKKFEETLDELQALATFLEKFVAEISKKDEQIKRQISAVN